jgi:pyruvate-formate lyase-activating enzyme
LCFVSFGVYVFFVFLYEIFESLTIMGTNYTFNENTEPTEKQLSDLMKAVVIDVKARAEKSEKEFKKQMNNLILNTLREYKLLKNGN